MIGLIYKDFLVMKKEISLNALVILLIMLFMNLVFFPLGEETQFLAFLEVLMYMLIFSILGGLQNNALSADENRYYSSFVMSTPLSAKGQVLSKYYEALILALIGVTIGMVGDIVSSFVLGYVRSGMNIYMALFFIQIFLRAIDVPFLIRFGQRYGRTVKVIMLAVAAFLVIVYGLFGPMPDGGIEGMIEAMAEWFYNMENMSTLMLGIVSIFPYFAVICFYISYRISVRLYKKGVNAYEC